MLAFPSGQSAVLGTHSLGPSRYDVTWEFCSGKALSAVPRSFSL
jgi:hypothetical protein